MTTKPGSTGRLILSVSLFVLPTMAFAISPGCSEIYSALGQGPSCVAGSPGVLARALGNATPPPATNGGSGLTTRGTLADRDGSSCSVAFTGAARRGQRP